jgi:hypothetical protein
MQTVWWIEEASYARVQLALAGFSRASRNSGRPPIMMEMGRSRSARSAQARIGRKSGMYTMSPRTLRQTCSSGHPAHR